MTTEPKGPDGCVITKVRVGSIRLLDAEATKARARGSARDRYAEYCDHIYNGRFPNGLPILYRTAKGNLFAADDLRDSDLVIYARRHVVPFQLPGMPVLFARDLLDLKTSVKIIEVENRADIPAQRAAYLMAQEENTDISVQRAILEARQNENVT